MQCNSTAFPPTHGEKGCCFCKLVWITTTFCFVIRSSSLYKASSKCWLSFYTFVMLIIDSFSYAKDQWSATTHAVENHAVPSKVCLRSQIIIFNKLFPCLCQTTLLIGIFMVRQFTSTFYGNFFLPVVALDVNLNAIDKVEKILKGRLDSIPSPSTSVKIQIIGRKVSLR